MLNRRLLRLDSDGLEVVADLSKMTLYPCNDMVVDSQGRAYIGSFGFDFYGKKPFNPADIILVTPDGNSRIIANQMAFPNGMVINQNERILIVGESFGACLSAFDVGPDGSLTGRRVWAKLQGAIPD